MATLSAADVVFASARHRAVCNITPPFSLSLTHYSYVVYLATLLVTRRVYGVMNWKGCKRKSSRPRRRYCPCIYMEG
jgi:hypothetical protein